MSSQSNGEINFKSFEIEWKADIGSFLCDEANEDYISSTPFSCNCDNNIKLCMVLRLDSFFQNTDKDCIFFYLKNLSSFEIEATVNLSLITNNLVAFKLKQKLKPKVSIKPYSKNLYNILDFNDVSSEKSVFRNGNQITIACGVVIHSIFNQQPNSFTRQNEFNDFEKLLLNEKFCDLSIISADGKKLNVHKGILASRSPVFLAMLEHDMLEKKQNIVKINDVNYEVLLEVFRFMYSGKVNNIEMLLIEILCAAEKYSIEGLKLLCEETMLLNLKQENAIKYLVAAQQNNLNSVKTIIEYIVTYAKQLVKTPEFKSLGMAHPDLTHEIINAVVDAKSIN